MRRTAHERAHREAFATAQLPDLARRLRTAEFELAQEATEMWAIFDTLDEVHNIFECEAYTRGLRDFVTLTYETFTNAYDIHVNPQRPESGAGYRRRK